MAPVAMRPFGPASIARAVAAQIAAQTQVDARAPTQAPAQKKRDRVWNGVLIGAGVGAALGGISAATEDDECHVDCYGLAGTVPDYIAVLGSALVGAGVGAIVDLLIK